MLEERTDSESLRAKLEVDAADMAGEVDALEDVRLALN